MAEIDPNTARYEDLTAPEQAGMEQFIRQWLAGEQHEAIRRNTLALDMEHLVSTFPLDPAEVKPELLEELRRLREEFHQLTGVKVLFHVLGEI